MEQAYDYKQPHKQEGRVTALQQAGSSTQQNLPQSELRSRPVHARTIPGKSYSSVVAPLKTSPPDPATFQSTIAPVNTTTTTITATTKILTATKDAPPPEKSPVVPNVADKAPRPMQSTGEAAISQPSRPSLGTLSSPSLGTLSTSSEVPKPKMTSMAPLVPPSRKVKATRKVVSRKPGAQQLPQHTASPELSPSTAETKSDQLYRKESEVSIRSSDSDTSSGDKQEEREDVTVSRDGRGLDTLVEVEGAAKMIVPLTKEPGTGQTVPMVIPEDRPQPTPSTSENQSSHQRGTEKEVPVAYKLRGRKLRQHQKKEEKLKRRESERSKATFATAYQPDSQKQQQPCDDVFAPTGSAIQGSRIAKAPTKDKSASGGGGHTGSESSPSPLPQGEGSSKDLSEEPEQTLAQSNSSSVDNSRYQKEKQQHELESSQESHPSTSSLEERTGDEVVTKVHLDYASVPSSAVRTRGKAHRHADGSGALTEEEVQGQLPQPSDDSIKDGSLVEGGCVAKGGEDYDQSGEGNVRDDGGRGEEGTCHDAKAEPSDEEEDAKESADDGEQLAERPQTLQINNNAAMPSQAPDGAASSREPAPTVQEGSDSPPRVVRVGPTSPHELAVSLLSNNPVLVRRTKHRDESGEEVEEVKRASSGKHASKPSIQKPNKETSHPPPPVIRHRNAPSVDRSPQKSNVARPSFSPDAPPFVPMEFAPQPPAVSNSMRPRYMGPPLPPPPAPQEVCQGYMGFLGYEDPVHHRPPLYNPMSYKQRKAYPPVGGRAGFAYAEHQQQLYDDVEADPYGSYEPTDDQPPHIGGGRIAVPRGGGHDTFLDMHCRTRVPAQGFARMDPRMDYAQQQETTRMFVQQHHHHHASQQRMVPPGFQSAGSQWEDAPPMVRQQPPPYTLVQQHEQEEIRRPHPQMGGMFRPHGRRSVDSMTMSSFNSPMRASSAHYSHEQWAPMSQGGNLWEIPQRVPIERTVDMGVIPSDHHHHPHPAPHFQRPTQRQAVVQRKYSEGSDLGGEMLPDLNPSSINTPLSSRAPGSLLSTNVSPSQRGGGGGMGGQEESAEERPQWPTGENTSSSSAAWPSTIWSTSSQDVAPAATSFGSRVGGRTYGLFESSAIWGNNSFSWVQPKSSQEQKN